jgi:SAM-dependent methyltransferase
MWGTMNKRHLELCASAEWAQTVRDDILPWAVGSRDLGDAVLEIGPGPGLTTNVLHQQVPYLTALELDQQLAAALANRLSGSNVTVVRGDAAALPFASDRFSGAVCFTMLHHVPSPTLQDRLFAEVRRVLRPGGLLVGVDSLDRPEWRELHEDDVCVPVDPATLAARLASAGLESVEVERAAAEPSWRFRFAARAPA